MSRGNLTWLLAVPAVLLAGLLVSYSAPLHGPDAENLRTVASVFAAIDQNYYRELSPEEKRMLVEGMLDEGLRSLDENSQFLGRDAYALFEDDNIGAFGGVGILMEGEIDQGHLVVRSPMPGTPAYEAGIGPGDVILKVNGVDTASITRDEVRKLITGPPGTDVTLTMLRGDRTEPEDIVLKRAIIPQHAVAGYERDPADLGRWNFIADRERGIALIRLERFNEKSTVELKEALEACRAAGAKALILDMRGNPGGLLNEACSVADLFLPGGEIVATRNRNGRGKVHSAKNDNTPFERAEEWPMVVLVDRLSASAAEIVAAALQDHGRAVVIGERSFGKGSVQKVYPLPPDDQRAVKLTAETWWTPRGRNIHRSHGMTDQDQWGVLPNDGHAVPLSRDDWLGLAALRRQLDVIPGKPGVAPPRKPAAEPAAEKRADPVLERALEHFRNRGSAGKNAA